jgi:cell division protein FtsB
LLASHLQAAAEVRSEHAARLSELSSQLASSNAQLAKLRASCAGLQKKVAGLQDKIDNAGGEPLRKQKERVASLMVRNHCGVAVAELISHAFFCLRSMQALQCGLG